MSNQKLKEICDEYDQKRDSDCPTPEEIIKRAEEIRKNWPSHILKKRAGIVERDVTIQDVSVTELEASINDMFQQ